MTQPIWRRIVSNLPVPEPGKQWTLAVEVAPAGKMIMIEATGEWTPSGAPNSCTPDGLFLDIPPADGSPAKGGLLAPAPPPAQHAAALAAQQQNNAVAPNNPPQTGGGALTSSAPRGALIARLGGSTADQGADTPATGQQATRIIFSIGRKCVFIVPTTPVGSLFLGINDHPTMMTGVQGSLRVQIYEAI